MKRLKTAAAALFIFISMLSSCTAPKPEKNGYTFNDSLGNSITVSGSEKTAALSGSLAEIWYLAGGELSGVTADAYDGHNFEVPETAVNYGTMKSPSVEQMTADGIELAILSSASSDHKKLYDVFNDVGITTAYFEVETFDDYLEMLDICTDITGRKDLYEKNGTAVKSEVDEAKKYAEKALETREKPRVLLLRAYSSGIKVKSDDVMAGAMLKELGCENIADSTPSLLEELSIEQIVADDPEFIFITTMGADDEAAIAVYNETLASNPAWSGLSAVKNGRVHILPQELYHYKPTTRWGEAYRKLAEIIYE